MSKQWYEQKEAVKTSIPVKITYLMVKILPLPVVCLIIFPVSFFYYLFSSRARKEVERFQKQMQEFTGGHVPAKKSVYKTFYSFSLYLVERIAGWMGKIQPEDIFFNDDDIEDFWKNLDEGKGVMLLGSHIGNMDLLRSICSVSETGLDRKIPVTAIIETSSSEKFSEMMKSINDDYDFSVIDSKDIGPDTIVILQEKISRGEIVVCFADRVSAHSANRFIRTKFLGREANFPYGVFLMAALLECPVYFCYGLRDSPVMLRPVNAVYMERSGIDFCGCDRKEREEKIRKLCEEYVLHLEKYGMWFYNQWYNFYDFWNLGNAE